MTLTYYYYFYTCMANIVIRPQVFLRRIYFFNTDKNKDKQQTQMLTMASPNNKNECCRVQ